MKITFHKRLADSPSAIFILFSLCFSVVLMDLWRDWHDNQSNIYWDTANYYSYLPAYFSNHGSFDFHNESTGYLPVVYGNYMPKVTYGLSVLYSPFYALAYKIALNQGSPTNGFSEPFYTCLHWGGIFYALLGLVILRKFLLKFFDELTVAITLAILFFGTNLFHYTLTCGEAPHGHLFFLISVFLLLCWHWYENPKFSTTVLLGIITGLISLIRPTEITTVLIFIFWKVHSKRSFLDQMKRLWENKWKLLLMAATVILLWLPQMIFWKWRTGTYLFFSYGSHERFFWGDPQIMNVLFSYRKGWLLYTPLIGLAFIGFFFMKGEIKKFRWLLLFLLVLNVYMISCWWDWFFGGGFGARAFVQHLAWLSLPLASFCASFISTVEASQLMKLLRPVFFVIVFSGITLNMMQNYQYIQRYIHANAETKKAYWAVFGKYKMNESEFGMLWGYWRAPDYEKLSSGEDRDQ